MNDLYLKLANSQYTQPLFQALNLPQPQELKRTPEESGFSLHGAYLIFSTKSALATSEIIKSINSDKTNICIARSNSPQLKLTAAPTNFQGTTSELQVESLGSQKFNGLIFDASGIKTINELKQLYLGISKAIRQVRRNGRIIVISQTPSATQTLCQASIQGGIEGFIKSIAKETGKKGITCNVIQIEKGAQKHIGSSINFLLSSKSSYITGQSVKLGNQSVKVSRINSELPLKGKTAIVTGAAQGIGKETAKVLARDGATVVCLDIPSNEKLTNQLAKEIGGHPLSLDLSDTDASSKIVKLISSHLGIIDIIVHNAGITRDKTLANMPEHFWDQVLDINLAKVIEINDALLNKGVIATNGRIICISSISGIAGNFGQTNYAMSKAGIASYNNALSQHLANNRQDGITVNTIAPGFIETQMTNKIPVLTREFGRRLNSLSQGGLPADIAEGVSFFCHPASQALNGNLLRICGQSLLGK